MCQNLSHPKSGVRFWKLTAGTILGDLVSNDITGLRAPLWQIPLNFDLVIAKAVRPENLWNSILRPESDFPGICRGLQEPMTVKYLHNAGQGLQGAATGKIIAAKMPKVPVFRCQKMALPSPKQKNGYHFLTPTTPQNGVEHVCFMRLALLGGF